MQLSVAGIPSIWLIGCESGIECCRLGVSVARVAELVDALVLGTSALCMGVRVPPLAPLVWNIAERNVTK